MTPVLICYRRIKGSLRSVTTDNRMSVHPYGVRHLPRTRLFNETMATLTALIEGQRAQTASRKGLNSAARLNLDGGGALRLAKSASPVLKFLEVMEVAERIMVGLCGCLCACVWYLYNRLCVRVSHAAGSCECACA